MQGQSVLNIIISNQYNFTRLLFVQSTHWIQIINDDDSCRWVDCIIRKCLIIQ